MSIATIGRLLGFVGWRLFVAVGLSLAGWLALHWSERQAAGAGLLLLVLHSLLVRVAADLRLVERRQGGE